MKRVIRDRRLTPEEAARYKAVREQVAEELPDLIARHHERMATLDQLHDLFMQLKSSSPGEFHPRALTEPDGSLSTHPALITRPLPALPRRVVPPHHWVDPTTRRDDWAPSLRAHYRPF